MPVLDPVIVAQRLRRAAASGASRSALLGEAASAVQSAGPPYTSVYLYMLHGETLELEAHSGRDTEHTRIAVGHGVCGTAVATGTDQNVGDVRAVGNYIACNLFTRSELVVLIRQGDRVVGQIDIDSDLIDPFTPDEEAAVRAVADLLGELL